MKYYYLVIEGVGLESSGGDPYEYRFCTRVPTGVAETEQWIGGLALPLSIEASLDIVRWEMSSSGMTFDVPHTATTRALLLKSHASILCYLDGAIDDNDTTGAVTGGTLATGNYWLERECIHVSDAGAPTWSRAELWTSANDHADGTPLFSTNPILATRTAWLYETDETNSYDTLIWKGAIASVSVGPGLTSITIEATDAGAFMESPICSNPTVWRASPLVTSAGTNFWDVYSLSQAGTAADPKQTALINMIYKRDAVYPAAGDPGGLFMISGQLMHATINFAGGVIRNFSMYASRPESAESGQEEQCFESLSTAVPDYNAFMYQVVAGGAYVETVDPIYIALILLLSRGYGRNKQGGDVNNYDTLPRPWGLGLFRSQIDLDAWEAFAGLYVAPSVQVNPRDTMADILEKLLRPIGLMWFVTAARLISVTKLTDYAPSNASLVPIILTQVREPVTTYDRALEGAVGRLTINWGSADSEARDVLILEENIEWYSGQLEEIEVDASFYRSQNDTRAEAVQPELLSLLGRLRFPPPVITVEVSLDHTADLGDYVSLTHSKLGLTNAVCFVSGVRFLFDTGARVLTLWYVGHDLARFGTIGPAAEVDYYVPSTYRVYFQTTTPDEFNAGDAVVLKFASGENRSDPAQYNVTIDAIGSNYITISGAFNDSGASLIYPREGEWVALAGYNYSASDEQDRHFFAADDSGLLGTSNAECYYWGG